MLVKQRSNYSFATNLKSNNLKFLLDLVALRCVDDRLYRDAKAAASVSVTISYELPSILETFFYCRL